MRRLDEWITSTQSVEEYEEEDRDPVCHRRWEDKRRSIKTLPKKEYLTALLKEFVDSRIHGRLSFLLILSRPVPFSQGGVRWSFGTSLLVFLLLFSLTEFTNQLWPKSVALRSQFSVNWCYSVSTVNFFSHFGGAAELFSNGEKIGETYRKLMKLSWLFLHICLQEINPSNLPGTKAWL